MGAAGVLDVVPPEPFGEIARKVTPHAVAEQAGHVGGRCRVASRGLRGLLESLVRAGGRPRVGKRPGENVAALVVEGRGQLEP